MTTGATGGAAQTGYRWYVLAILTIAQTCHGIDRAIIGLVLQPVGQEFGLTGAQLGLLAGVAYGVPFALAAIPFGYAVDRYNSKTLMTFALSAWSAATALCGAVTGFWTMLAGRAAVGVAEAGGSPTGMVTIHSPGSALAASARMRSSHFMRLTCGSSGTVSSSP